MIVDSHAHLAPPDLLDAIRNSKGQFPSLRVIEDGGSLAFAFAAGKPTRPVSKPLSDMAARLAWMDQQGIARQVVGGWVDMFGYELPAAEGEAWSRLINDALLAAAHRWGLRATILTAVLMAAPLLTHAVLVSTTGSSLGIARLAGTVDTREFFVASALILLGGVALAYVTQAEQQFRAEAEALGAVVSRVQLRSGLKNTMGAVIDAVVVAVVAEST